MIAVILLNILILGFIGACALFDNDGTMAKLGPRGVLLWSILTWLLGLSLGSFI